MNVFEMNEISNFQKFHRAFPLEPYFSTNQLKTYLNSPKIDSVSPTWEIEKKMNPSNDQAKKWFENLEKARTNNVNMGIMRVSNRPKALYIDFDFKLPTHVSATRVEFQHDDFENIQRWVLDALEICTHIPKTRIELANFVDCLILQRDEDIDPEKRKFGMHVEFPFLVLDNGSSLIECMKHIGMRKEFSFPHENSVEECLDNCMNKAWYLYGSGKKSNKNPYQITHICQYGNPPKSYNKNFTDEIITFFKKHKLTDWNGNDVKIKKGCKIESMLIFLLDPAHYCKGNLPEFVCVFNREEKKKVQDETVFLEDGLSTHDDATIESLLMSIDNKWAEDWAKWMTIAFALKRYYTDKQQDETGLRLFHLFSQRCPEKYKEHETTSLWHSLKLNSTAYSNDLVATLTGRRRILTRNNSLPGSQQFSQSYLNDGARGNVQQNYQSILFPLKVEILPCLCLNKTESCYESLISYERHFSLSDPRQPYGNETFKWLFEELVTKRVIKIPQREGYIIFNGHSVWVESDLPSVKSTLQSQISENVLQFQCDGPFQKSNIFTMWFDQLEQALGIPQNLPREDQQKIHNKLVKTTTEGKELQNMKKAVNDAKTLESAIKSILTKFEVSDLIQSGLLKVNNENLGIVPFTNGAFDCYTGTFRNTRNFIRAHKKEVLENQMINSNVCIDKRQISEIFTHSTKYDFEEINEDDINNLMAFMRDVLPNEDILEFFLDILSESAFGRNYHNKIVQMIGKGANGKSTLTRLLELAFGEMFQAMSSSAVNESSVRKQSGGPDSFLMQITKDHVRLITMADIPNFKFDHSMLKKLSGLDQIAVRDLYQKAVSRICGALILLGGNSVIRLTAMEPAMVRRLIFIPFNTTFVTQSDYDAMSEETRRNVRIKKDIDDEEMIKMGKTLMVFLCKRLSDRIRVAKENGSIRTLDLPPILKQYQEDCIFRTTNFLEFVKTRFVRSNTVTTDALQIRESFLSFEKAPHGKQENLTPEMVENMLESVFERVQVGNNVHFKIKHVEVESMDM